MPYILLNAIPSHDLTLLKDVGIHIKFDKKGKFKYFYISLFDIKGIRYFILALENQSLFTVILIFSISDKDEDPHMILSKNKNNKNKNLNFFDGTVFQS
jgi:hypothetical protein